MVRLKVVKIDAADLIGELLGDSAIVSVCDAQWDSYINEIVKMIKKRKIQLQEKNVNIDSNKAGNWIAMCDVSGSMFLR